MRNILRKLHIVPSQPEDADGSSSSPSRGSGRSPPDHSDQKPFSPLASWFNSAASRHASPVAADVEGREERGSGSSQPRGIDLDEEHQIQLALEMSVREDPEAAQIEAVKQISLGPSAPPVNNPAEVLSYRYLNYNVLGYDDKIVDGFYDLHGILDDSTVVKMPSLSDLQGKPVSDSNCWEGVLVNRAEDIDLLQLEQKALSMVLQLKSKYLDFVATDLVHGLAILVSNHMGGAICDPATIQKSWINLSNHLRASIGKRVLPLGRLTIGLARHRALLFKVLADSLDIPCRLVKGQQYTGSDDGALNIVKLKDGREYIVDLMVDPGTLIPSDGARLSRDYGETSSVTSGVSSHISYSENEPLDQRCMPNNIDTSNNGSVDELRNHEKQEIGSSLEKSSAQEYVAEKVNILDKFSNSTSTGMEKSQGPSGRPNHQHRIARSPSWTEGISSPAVMMKVKDISQYMINATKENPQLAQKLHDVLLESGVVAPPNLFEISAEPSEAVEAENMFTFENKDALLKGKNGLTDKNLAEGSHGPYLPDRPIRDVQQKVVPSRSQLDPLKRVEGSRLHHPLDVRETSPTPCPSHSEASSAESPDPPLPFIKHIPFAAAAATAAVVASTMVVAAAKSNSDMNLEVPVAAAATATAAAVVATTAAVSKQYEHLEASSLVPIVSSCSDTKNSTEKNGGVIGNSQLGIDRENDVALVLKQDATQAHPVERCSDKSTGNESAKSDVSLDDVAELEIPWEDITLGERIGLGSFGEVYRGDWHGTEVAVKKFLHQDISGDALEEFITEVRIMKRLRHPNVVLLMGAVTRVPNLSIVTEFLHRGSLFRLIHRLNSQLDERRRLRMAFDVARGMNYLHNCVPIIVHRDLKSPNLLVDKNWVVKVCDFGLSRMKHNTFLSSRSTAGTAEWMAPEVLRNEPSDEKCDVYSFGVILWELCTLQQPWGGMNPMQVVGAVGFQHRRLDIPDGMDPVIADIINKCWTTDPKMRPSFSEIMAALRPLQKPATGSQAQRQRAQIAAENNRQKGAS